MAVLGGYGRAGHVAVLGAPIHAHEQVPLQARPLDPPWPSGTVRNWGPLQPPARRSLLRHLRGVAGSSPLGHDSANQLIFLLVRDG